MLSSLVRRGVMKAEMDKIVSLSEGESADELQKYLSSLTNDQVAQFTKLHFCYVFIITFTYWFPLVCFFQLITALTNSALKGKKVCSMLKGVLKGKNTVLCSLILCPRLFSMLIIISLICRRHAFKAIWSGLMSGIMCSRNKVCPSFSVGSPPVSSEGANRRLLVYEHLIPLCESGDLQAEVAADIIGLLMLEVKRKLKFPFYLAFPLTCE